MNDRASSTTSPDARCGASATNARPVDGESPRIVFIDCHLPEPLLLRLLGHLLGGLCASWCTENMATDAAAFFAPPEPQLR